MIKCYASKIILLYFQFHGAVHKVLAAWFKLKYPYIALGALASSAPLLYFEDTLPKHGYFYIVTKVFKEMSKECHNKIHKSWDEIDRIAAKPNSLSILSKNFKLCKLCEAINTSPPNTKSDLLDQIFAGVVASRGNISCYGMSSPSYQMTNDDRAWGWQTIHINVTLST
ncbi:Peptidase S28 [Arabidopsis thaliana x Arabidopsis arenosa]|uniref:Peptidase S28 n=1 Tax=Arabidopsis thaliana x Arabidopsis arenosa TaxID=1240361 RepID=A0A8T2EUJ6_9BRAS|nr:Peptidase S28 [Arabidopsis thaliana x Arabidopsis arenosa]